MEVEEVQAQLIVAQQTVVAVGLEVVDGEEPAVFVEEGQVVPPSAVLT